MTLPSIASNCTSADRAFGPALVTDATCSDNFDFTLLFEQSILCLLPTAIAFVVFSYRLLYLTRKKVQARYGALGTLKQVEFSPAQGCAALYVKVLRLTFTTAGNNLTCGLEPLCADAMGRLQGSCHQCDGGSLCS